MSDWDRLEKVIKWTGLSVNAFAKSIKLKRAENLYQIKKGNNSISKDLANYITIKYCNISKSWLLTGEGDMFLDNTELQEIETRESEKKKIPYYDFDFSLLKVDEEGNLPPSKCYIEVPMLSNCDFATICVGDSMIPEIPSGAIITLKEIDIDLILSGETYYIITDKYSTVKSLRIVEEDRSKLRLIPKNRKEYDETLLDKTAIQRLYLVKGVISSKVL